MGAGGGAAGFGGGVDDPGFDAALGAGVAAELDGELQVDVAELEAEGEPVAVPASVAVRRPSRMAWTASESSMSVR